MGGTHEGVVIKFWSNSTLTSVGVEHVAGHCPRKESQAIILCLKHRAIHFGEHIARCLVLMNTTQHDNAIDHTSKAITATP